MSETGTVASGLRIAHDLAVAMDYGQFMIRGGQAEYWPDDATLLSEAHAAGEGVAADGRTVLVCSPRQYDSAMALRVEVWDLAPADDLDEWQEAFASGLEVGPEGRLRFDSPTTTPVECAVPPGRYQLMITGRGTAVPGTGDSWRVRLWPAVGDIVTRRLRSADPSWHPAAASAATTRRWTRDPEWTARLRTELLDRVLGGDCCRRAEAAALLRLTRDVPELREQVAGRLGTLLGGQVAHPGLPAELGLTSASGVPVRGLPPRLMSARRCCVAAVWRGALGVSGELIVRSDRMQALVRCEDVEPAMGLVGLGRRIGIADTMLREGVGVLVADGPALLDLLGVARTATAWRTKPDA